MTDAALSRWQSYSAYKPTGVEWLGDIPAHWEARRLKTALSRNNGGAWGEDFDDEGVVVLRSTEQTVDGGWSIVEPAKRRLSVKEYSVTRLLTGDLVITKSSGSALHIGKTSIVTPEVEALNCCFSNFMQRLRCGSDHDSRFVYYILNSPIGREQFVTGSNTTTGLANLNGGIIGNLRCAFPPPDEQRAIAAFLDRETTRLDALIAKKQRLIELLQEQRTALISQAVTKGLDPHVAMKDSGIPSIPQIPAHWTVERNKWIFREINDRSTTGEEELLTVSHITGVTPRSEKREVTMFLAESKEGYKRCQPDDLVINTMWAWMGALGITNYDGIVSPSYNVYRLTRQYIPKYLDYLYRTSAYVSEIIRYSQGVWTSRLRLYPEEFFLMSSPTPPLSEQQSIVEYIEHETGRYHKFVARLEESIDRLREYRTALIAAAVTGKMDVREAITGL